MPGPGPGETALPGPGPGGTALPDPGSSGGTALPGPGSAGASACGTAGDNWVTAPVWVAIEVVAGSINGGMLATAVGGGLNGALTGS